MSDSVTLIVDLDTNECTECMFGKHPKGSEDCPILKVSGVDCPDVGVWKVEEKRKN